MAPCSAQSRAHVASSCVFRPAWHHRPGLYAHQLSSRGVRRVLLQPNLAQEPSMRLTSRARCQQVASTVISTASSERDFKELAEMSGTGLNKVTARITDNQMGLVAKEAIKKGEMIIRVPLAVRKPACIV